MKIAVQSAIVFFGTLLAAALVAFGEPGAAEVRMAAQPADAAITVASLLGFDE